MPGVNSGDKALRLTSLIRDKSVSRVVKTNENDSWRELFESEERKVQKDNKYRDSGQLRRALEKSLQKIRAKPGGLSMKSLVLRCFQVLTESGGPGHFENPGTRDPGRTEGVTARWTAR